MRTRSLFVSLVAVGLALVAGGAKAGGPDVKDLVGKTVTFENLQNKRLLFSAGDPVADKEGGWTKSPAIVGADANYYDRALWTIEAKGDGFTITNQKTKRLVLSTGEAPADKEGGWTKSPDVVGADANYYDRAIWKITPKNGGFQIENAKTHRLLLATGDAATAKEGGWTNSPKVVGADANYYDRAIWRIAAK